MFYGVFDFPINNPICINFYAKPFFIDFKFFTAKFDQMGHDCRKVSEQARNNRMKDISGIGERLVALDQVIIAAKQQVKEQRGIAQVLYCILTLCSLQINA